MRQPREATKVTWTRDADVVRVVFEGPRGIQTLSRQTREALRNAVLEIAQLIDAGVRFVLFEGTGRMFISGAEISELAQLDAAGAYEVAREGQEVMQLIDDLPCVTIAAINGACAGGGCELALACDLRLIDSDALIGLPESTLGIVPAWGGTVRSHALLGEASAKRLMLTGQLLSAQQAHHIGLAHDVAAVGRLSDVVTTWLQQLRKASGYSQTAINSLLKSRSPISHDAYEAEARAFAACFESGQATEGLQAFLEKRPPSWLSWWPQQS